MLRIRIFAVAMPLAMLGCATLGPGPEAGPFEIAARVADAFDRGDDDTIVSLFFTPSQKPAYKLEERNERLARGLAVFRKHLGSTTGERAPFAGTDTYVLSLKVASDDFWQPLEKNGEFAQVSLLVEYKKAGPGCMQLSFYRHRNAWNLRNLSFGFPGSVDGAIERMSPLSNELFQVMVEKPAPSI